MCRSGVSEYTYVVFWPISKVCSWDARCCDLDVKWPNSCQQWPKIIFYFCFLLQTLCPGLLSAFPGGWSSSEVQWGERRAPGIRTASAHRKEKSEGKACYTAEPCWANPPVWNSMAAQQLQEIDRMAHHWDRLEVGGIVVKSMWFLERYLFFNVKQV